MSGGGDVVRERVCLIHTSLPARWLVICWLCIATLTAAHADDVVPNEPPARYWRGNLHTHTLWSDGNDFPEMVAEWYRTHDYNFLALTDHNVLSAGQRWMARKAITSRGGIEV
ncbi:MAG: hypothetical protein KDA92_17635, partial [Planctomycetales bacterium]|nr:hypothetical protein [Planctomycetales bacterium]